MLNNIHTLMNVYRGLRQRSTLLPFPAEGLSEIADTDLAASPAREQEKELERKFEVPGRRIRPKTPLDTNERFV